MKKLPQIAGLAALVAASVVAEPLRFYIGTGPGNGIYLAELDAETGALSAPRLAAEVKNAGFLAIHPNRRFLYSTATGPAGSKQGGVAAFAIQPDGALEPINSRSSEGSGPCHVSIDATGRCLMVANYGSGGVASYRILEDGSLSEAVSIHQHEGSGAHAERQKGPHAHSIIPNPANTFAYVPDLGIDQVVAYRLDPAAATLEKTAATPVPGSAMGPRHMKWSADGQAAYVLNELDLSLSLFRPGKAPGQLEHVATVSTLPEGAEKEGMTCAEIRIHPNGNFVYCSTRDTAKNGRDSLSLFGSSTHPEGFHRIATLPAEVSVPRNFNLDPGGRWMLVGGQQSKDIALFRIDPASGQATFTGTKIPVDGGPICLEFFQP